MTILQKLVTNKMSNNFSGDNSLTNPDSVPVHGTDNEDNEDLLISHFREIDISTNLDYDPSHDTNNIDEEDLLIYQFRSIDISSNPDSDPGHDTDNDNAGDLFINHFRKIVHDIKDIDLITLLILTSHRD